MDAKSKREEILKTLSANKTLRAEAIKLLARDFPKEYLKLVKLDPKKIGQVTPSVLISDKEWQE